MYGFESSYPCSNSEQSVTWVCSVGGRMRVGEREVVEECMVCSIAETSWSERGLTSQDWLFLEIIDMKKGWLSLENPMVYSRTQKRHALQCKGER